MYSVCIYIHTLSCSSYHSTSNKQNHCVIYCCIIIGLHLLYYTYVRSMKFMQYHYIFMIIFDPACLVLLVDMRAIWHATLTSLPAPTSHFVTYPHCHSACTPWIIWIAFRRGRSWVITSQSLV